MGTELHVGQIIQQQLEALDEHERIYYLLLVRYMELFTGIFGQPYWPGWEAVRRPRDHECFRAFVSLGDYLRGRGVAIGNREVPWQGYLRFALTWFAENGQIPCPTQLKNPVLLRKYMQQAPKHEDPATANQLAAIDYAKIVTPSLRGHDTLHLLGLL